MKHYDHLRSIVYIRQMHILASSRKLAFPISVYFIQSQFCGFLFVYLIENHFLQHLEVSKVRPTDFLTS